MHNELSDPKYFALLNDEQQQKVEYLMRKKYQIMILKMNTNNIASMSLTTLEYFSILTTTKMNISIIIMQMQKKCLE